MTSFFNPPNFLGRTLIGAVGLGVALLGLPQSAKAFTITGSQYGSTTLSGTTYTLPSIGTVAMQGVPLPSFPQFDTIIYFGDCSSTGMSCTTQSQIQALSLKSSSPVSIGGFSYDMFVSLDGTQDFGSVTFDDSNKTWATSLKVKSVATFTALNGGIAISPVSNSDTLAGTGSYTLSGSIPVIGISSLASSTKVHSVSPMKAIPEPSIVSSLAALGFGAALQKKWGKKNQKDQ